MAEEKRYHNFPKRQMKLREMLSMIRSSVYSNWDEGGCVVLCPECEEWTHVKFNQNSGLLDLLGELIVESIDADDDDIRIWIKTDDFNWFNLSQL